MPRFLAMLSLFLAPLTALGASLLGDPPTMPFSDAEIAFGASGLSAIRYGGFNFLQSGDLGMNEVKLKTASGGLVDGGVSRTTAMDAANNAVEQTYSWGSVRCAFRQDGSHVLITTKIHNTSARVIESFNLSLPTLKFPAKPAEYDGNTPLLGHTVGETGVVLMSYGKGVMVLTNEDPSQPLMAGFPWAFNRPTSTIFPLVVNTGRVAMYPGGTPDVVRPIAAGATLEFTLALRFGPTGATPATMAADVFEKTRAAFPFRVSWSDRRSIGSLFLATAAAGWPKNPRGWFNNHDGVDVTTPEGVATFKTFLLAYANRSIPILKAMNSQGMITWDIEGEQFPHATTYIGDPRMAEQLAPEITGAVDEYFKRFRDAGLRVGVTIRPQQLVLAADGKSATQQEVADPAKQLMEKIAYAKNRWGATLFYIDSNGDPNFPTDAAAIERIATAFPDVLLIPESQNLRYYATTAPYDELRRGIESTSSTTRLVYPQAFSVINIADIDSASHHDALLDGVRRGDILLYHAWFDDPMNAAVKQIYDEAAQ